MASSRSSARCKIGSASIYGFSGPADVAADQSQFWVTYDDQYLYFAHHSPPPAKIAGQVQLVVAMLANSVTRHDDIRDSPRCTLDPGTEIRMQ